ncbi:glycosyltransferase family 4 protein [bacterium]|nr:glycosyltransferase family 4 protein [bacterium]
MPEMSVPLRLAIDGNEANLDRRVGSNTYAYQLLLALEKLTRSQAHIYQITVLLAGEPVADMPAPRVGWNYRVIRPRPAWTQWGLPLHLFLHQSHYDVFFTPGHYAPRWCSLPYISSVMDLAFLRYPELFRPRDLYQLQNWTRYSVAHAQKVVCISRFTKSEVEKFYHRDPQDLIVAYPGFAGKVLKLTANSQRQLLKDLHVKNNYFLYLGTLQPRKNIILMIDAFEKVIEKKKFKKYQLILAGKNGWLTDEIEHKIATSPASDQIVLTGFVSEQQKATLLLNATATLNLGIYEGFGIPPLESLAYGTLPIVANNTAMPEVVGTAGLSVNPYRVESVVKAMIVAANLDFKGKQKFFKLADRQVRKFSYQKAAKLVLRHLTDLVDLETNS